MAETKKSSLLERSGRLAEWALRLHNGILRIEDPLRLATGRLFWREQSNLVSFPIATFDRADILVNRTIPAILKQTHQDVEIVIVLDGSEEACFEKVRELNDSRVRIKRLPRRTRYPSDPKNRWMVAGWRPRNIAARLSRGNWIYWISDDDVLLPDAVEKLLSHAKASGAETVSASFQKGYLNPVISHPDSGQENFGVDFSGPPVWLVRRYIGLFRWNRYSWLNSWNRPSDYDLVSRLTRLGAKFSSIDDVLGVQPEVEGTESTGLSGALRVTHKNASEV